MSLLGIFKTETAQLETYLGESGTGIPQYGDPVSVTGVFEPKARTERGTGSYSELRGDDTLADLEGFLPATTCIHPQDRLTLAGKRYRVLEVREMKLEGKAHHVEALFQEVA